MAYRITGTVFAIGQTQTFQSKSGNPYNMRELVITIRKFDPYTGQPSDDTGNTPKFTLMGEKCQQLDNIKVGNVVVVHFDISGREYQKDGKVNYITDIRPFRVELLNNTSNQQPQKFQQQDLSTGSQPTSTHPQPSLQPEVLQQTQTVLNPPKKDDDLPF